MFVFVNNAGEKLVLAARDAPGNASKRSDMGGKTSDPFDTKMAAYSFRGICLITFLFCFFTSLSHPATTKDARSRGNDGSETSVDKNRIISVTGRDANNLL